MSNQTEVNTQSLFSGFKNGLGESNCFLNAALQILIQIDEFRFRIMMENSFPEDSVHSLLREIFTQYQKNLKEIDISVLRLKLAELYSNLSLFDLYMPGDATEVLIEILKCLHNDYENAHKVKCLSKSCISHSLFKLSVQETLICECSGQKIVEWDPESFAHHLYISQLFIPTRLTREMTENTNVDDFKSYFHLTSLKEMPGKLSKTLEEECFCSLDYCAGGNDFCQKKSSIKTSKLLEAPKVYISHVIWDHSHPSRLKLLQFFAAIPMVLDLKPIFQCNQSWNYGLTSLMAFGMGHYIALIYKKSRWFCIDDEKSTMIGNWYDLTVFLLRQRFYPVSLFYLQNEVLEHETFDFMKMVQLEFYIVESDGANESQNQCRPEEEWTCDCGFRNSLNLFFCDHCQKNKPGVEGWVCSFCTFFNQDSSLHCEACSNEKAFLPKKSLLTQKTPGLHKSQNFRNFNASQKRRQSSLQKCKLCDVLLSETLPTCIRCSLKSLKLRCGLCGGSTTVDYCENCISLQEPCSECLSIHIPGYCIIKIKA